MSRFQSPFVTACQQLLALAAVLAVLTPAASLVSLDVVRQPPAAAGAEQGALTAYARAARKVATLPAGPVEAQVREVPLRATGGVTARRVAGGAVALTSAPEVVTGYGAVGVTWGHGTDVAEDDLSVEARTLDDGAWSGWTEMEYHAEHGPDPDSAEGRRARPGTEPLFVGDVDRVQVRVTDLAGAEPTDLRLAVIDPGAPTRTVSERAALDTTTTDASTPSTVPAAREGVTPEPQIFSRAQWGADESMRSGTPSYFEVHAGYVHHTVNANDYTREQVPGILRSIYAYHTRSRGWSDVGYNFLVDRFGRIWEGRAGGVDRPVVGAHTLGYNEYSFAMSAIGNFETAQPSQAMVEAYGALFAWKLSLHGVDAASTRQVVGSDTFQAINGHRDAGQTACPGKNLYARIGDIRQLAAAAQVGWEGRDLDSDLVGAPYPDLVARRASDGRLVILPTGGLTRVDEPTALSTGWGAYDATLVSPDLTGDGAADVLGRLADGSLEVRALTGGSVLRTVTSTRGHDLLATAGDVDADGLADLVGRDTATGGATLFRGRGGGGFTAQPLAAAGAWAGYDLLAGVGDLDADGTPDLVARDAAGTLWLLPAGGAGVPGVLVQGGPRYDAVTGMADWNADGRTDLLVRRQGGHAFVLPGRGDGTVGAPRGPVKRLKGRADLAGVGDLTGTTAPDVVVRRGDELLVLAGAGTFEIGGAIETAVRAASADVVLNAGDWDGDGFGDLLLRLQRTGAVKLRAGDGQGGFGKAVTIGTGMGDVRLLEAVGDMTGDGWPDLMGQPAGGSMRIYPGRGAAALGPSYVAHSALSGTRQVGVGRWDGDGAPDTLVRRGDDLLVYRGNGPGGLTGGADTGLDLAGYDLVTGIADATLAERPDLVVREQATGRLLLLERTADGFKAPRVLADGAEVYDLVD